MPVLLTAPTGVGKGTLGALIAVDLDIPHVATGDVVRDHVAKQPALGQPLTGTWTAARWCPTRLCSTWSISRTSIWSISRASASLSTWRPPPLIPPAEPSRA